MTDPWNPPDPWAAPNPWAAPGDRAATGGWGAPQPPRRGVSWVPFAVVSGVAVLAAAALVVLGPGEGRREDAAPGPVATSSPPPAARPSRTRAPEPTDPTAVPTPAPTAKPVPVRTYSAPPAGVPVHGRVVDTNGRPVSGAFVSLTQKQGAFEAFFTAFAMLGTLGLACLTEICELPYGEGRTGSDGRFTVFLEKVPDDYTLAVGDRSGPNLTATVKFTGKPVRLPDVTVWSPAPFLEREGTRARVRFRTPPSSLGTWQSARAVVTDRADNELVSLPSARSGDEFDARLLEDAAGELSVSVAVRTRIGVTTYVSQAPVKGAHRPASRGRPCFEYGRAGRPIANRPCGLTDGNLAMNWAPKVADFQCENGSPCDRKVMVDLGSPRRLTYVVARGCKTFFDEMEVSADGRTWQNVMDRDTEVGDAYDVCAFEVDAVARYVRLVGPAGGFYTSRREISLY